MSNIIFKNVRLGNKKSACFSIDDMIFPLEKIVAVLGAKDVGKTEFMELLTGKVKPYSGTITYEDENMAIKSKSDLFFVDDKTYLPAYSSLNALMEKYEKEYPAFSKETAVKYFEKMEIPVEKYHYRNFDRKVQDAINCIFAIAARTKYTVLDQPCRNLNLKLRAMIYEFAKEDYELCPRTIIISSNIGIDIDSVASQVVYIRAKKALYNLPYDEVDKFAVGLLGKRDVIDSVTKNLETFYSNELEDDMKQVIIRNELSFEMKQDLALKGVITQYVNMINFHGYIVKEDFGLDELARAGTYAADIADNKAHNRATRRIKEGAPKAIIARQQNPQSVAGRITEQKKETFMEKLKRILTSDLF